MLEEGGVANVCVRGLGVGGRGCGGEDGGWKGS